MGKKLLFFDIECANCFDGKGKICSIGYVLTDDRFNIIMKFDLLLNPKTQWDYYVAKNLLGYKKEEFKGKPTFIDEYSSIKRILTNPDHLIFGFDVKNDFKYINDECERYGLEKINAASYDIQDFCKQYKNNRSKKGLTSIAAELEIDISAFNPHISRDDAEISMLIMKSICERMELSAEDLAGLCEKSTVDALNIERYVGNESRAALREFNKELSKITNACIDQETWKKVCFSDTIPLDSSLLTVVKSMIQAKLNFTNKVSECNYFVRGKAAGKRDKSYEINVADSKDIKGITMDELIGMLEIAQAKTIESSALN